MISKLRKENYNQKNKNRTLKVAVAIVLSLIVVVGIGIVFKDKKTPNGGNKIKDDTRVVASIVEFNVNPSLEMRIDKEKKVVDVIALNEEGKKVLNNMKLKNTDLDVAVNAIIGSMLKNGYISDVANSILVSVKDKDITKGEQLQKEISNRIEDLLNSNKISASVLTQIYEDEDNISIALAEKNNVSVGKAKLIGKIARMKLKDASGNNISEKKLAEMSINELKLLIDSKKVELENVMSKGMASDKAYIGKEKAKTIALNDAQVYKENVNKVFIDMDYDDGRIIYEVEFRKGNTKYEYDINAKTGDILDKEIDREDNKEDDKDDDREDDLDDDYERDKYDDDYDNRQKKNSKKNDKKERAINNNEEKNANVSMDNNSNNISNNKNNYIGETKAKNIAYVNAGVSVSNVKGVKLELDRDDGKTVYEIEFISGRSEYEYTIDAITGAILEKDIDND